jgi:predicted DNA-binding transcriptional regulator AlpA
MKTKKPTGHVCLKASEVAALLRIHPVALARMNRRGLGPKGFKIGRLRRWLASSVEEYLRSMAEKATRK